ncbi:SAM-dependent methyltransferase [Granulibacter bethesdensis]|uniref:SAM-dependent methyltransferase n=2 Tax=Granulibacter bethesdensis TaxID=364410 RepID=Q0BVV2_GRABC|nr:SAM-dependent methyltransferase [Granulibacter bethesdensis CGDNIH1]AHJ67140.1 SAM-dependent methyltransferase [Granulibacter bethesdensis]APH50824.1 SAM-dependent methyltransferase [Granulibacter bethesdensis]APH63518.1 SAM-dependent methyltransferase [Granulibacter bethesdensis]
MTAVRISTGIRASRNQAIVDIKISLCHLSSMELMLTQLRACAEPTRLRLLALMALGDFCVVELTDILGQSQPRLSRHLRLLVEAGLLERTREGSNAWFSLAQTGLGRDLPAKLPAIDATLQADRRQAERVLAERARAATERFRRDGAEWDEMRALGLPAETVEAALVADVETLSLPEGATLLDIGTGTGRILELLAPFIGSGLGIDASRTMLALARSRLSRARLRHCSVRQADMMRLPLPDASFDLTILHMVLHHSETPGAVITEAARMLKPGGTLLIVDLAAHERQDLTRALHHRWPGFSDAEMRRALTSAGLQAIPAATISGPIDIAIWRAIRPAGTTPAAFTLKAASIHD